MGTRSFAARFRSGFGFMALAVVMAALLAASTLFVFGGGSANAGGGDGDGKPGTRVAEAVFGVSVEPIAVDFNVIDGYLPQMHPGGMAMLEVKISNLSKTTDWEVLVEIYPDLGNSPYADELIRMAAYWDNGTVFRPGQTIVMGAGTVRALAIAITAEDGVGTREIGIFVRRLAKAGPVPTPSTPIFPDPGQRQG